MAYDAGRWGAGEKWVWLGEEGQAGSSAFRFLPFFFPRFSVGSGSATFSANCVGWGCGVLQMGKTNPAMARMQEEKQRGSKAPKCNVVISILEFVEIALQLQESNVHAHM